MQIVQNGQESADGVKMTQEGKTTELLRRHGIVLKKALGQNFLLDASVLERICEGANVSDANGVLEIGPGAGALTAALARRAGRVAAVELDSRLMPLLCEALHEFGNVTLIEGDAMKVDLGAIVSGELGGLEPLAVANLPYYITTPVISRLFESRLFRRVCVMVQKEVARRICAKPGTPDYSSFSVYCAYYSAPKILFDVPAGSFVPRPAVDSSVVLFECREELPEGDAAMFFRVLTAAFAQRRKTLVNNLSAAFGRPKSELSALVESLGFPADVRGERLGLEDFQRLAALVG